MEYPKAKKLLINVIVVVASTCCLAWGGLTLVYKSTLDFPLYQNEKYKGGTKAAELADFLLAGTKLQWAQKKLSASFEDGKPRRVFHAKQHACLTGKLV